MNKILPILLACTLLGFGCSNNGTTQPPGDNAPALPANPSPSDGAINVTQSPVLSWTCSDPDSGDTVKYDIYFSSTNPPNTLAATNWTFPNYAMPGLSANQIYYWRITARDSKGAWTAGPIWRFTTTDDSLLLGLVAYYPFNGNADDASSNGNNGTVFGATLTADKSGNVNAAYSFNGNGNYIQVPNASSFQAVSGLTVSAVVYPTGFYSGECQGNSIIAKGGDGDIGSWGLRYDENFGVGGNCSTFDSSRERFRFVITFADGNLLTVASNTLVVPNTWYSVTATYDGQFMKIYVNGILENTTPVVKSLGVNFQDIAIGRLFGLPGFFYWVTGVLDEIRVYNRALSGTEVLSLSHQQGW